MADRRTDSEWLMYASFTGDGAVEINVECKFKAFDPLTSTSGEETQIGQISGSLRFESLAAYQDFRAFWKGCGGDIAEV